MELAGYNHWLEYPEEIDKGSLIRFEDYFVVVTAVIYETQAELYTIAFEAQDSSGIFGAFHMPRESQIWTYTKQPS